MARNTNPRPLTVESLEPRALPDGNVSASVVGGSLILRGDHLDNGVVLDQRGLGAGEVRVISDATTTVNGEGGAAVVFSGVTRDVRVRLLAGDDRLDVVGVAVPRDLDIGAGAGDDVVSLTGVTVRRDLTVVARDGGDVVAVVAAAVHGLTRVDTGDGGDTALLSRSTFRGGASLRTGAGDDLLFLGGSAFRGRLSVETGPGDDRVTRARVTKGFDFREGAQGWRGDFADYPVGEEEFFELQAGIRPLPPELGVGGTGFYIQGNNHSDDLFMFLKRRLGPADGIEAGQRYVVLFTLEVASNAPSGCFGIGGAPGESVALTAGAFPREPVPVRGDDGHWRLPGKDAQGSGPGSVSVVGTLANGVPCEQAGDPPGYVTLLRSHVLSTPVRANRAGELWLLVGTDSGFEGLTALYYQRIRVTLIPVGA
jgi:hypothetical protein